MKNPVLYLEDGGERELPFKWLICDRCDGHGKSSAYLGAFTAQRMDEEGEDFREDYMSGKYDRACEGCGGSGKTKIVDETKLSRADLKSYREQEAEIEESHAIERQERLFEGGWREEGWFEQ